MNDHGRLARNPVSVLVFIGLAEIAGAQLIFGPEGSKVILSMPHDVQRMFAWGLLFSSLLVLLGTALPEPRAYWLEAGGKAGCAVVLGVYTFTLPYTVPSANTSMGFVFSTIGLACVLRLVWLAILILANFYPTLFAQLLTLRARALDIPARVRRHVRFRR